MKHLLLGGGVAAVLAAAVALSTRTAPATAPAADPNGLRVAVEAKNPWTDLKLNDSPEQFQFAVVSDRSGGHRAKVFSRAVYQINLLQPTFVMSVGDLIEGYSTDRDKVAEQWTEFDGYVKKFAMPFFYNPGNHDIQNNVQAQTWAERYGRKYYHFVYKNTLFLALCSENPEEKAVGAIDPAQQQYVAKVLAENPGVRWTFVFLHKPIWAAKDLAKNGWTEVEALLAGRKYTVFCGHVHRYQKFVRNGANYYQLATTGGASRLRGVDYGEFDQVALVTVKPDGAPVVANIALDGILPDDLRIPDTEEKGSVRKLLATVPVDGKVTLDGQPVPGATVRFQQYSKLTERWSNVADGFTAADGSFRLTTYTKFDGIPPGEYGVSVVKAPSGFDAGEAAITNLLPEKFADPGTSGLKVVVNKDGPNDVALKLTK